MKIHRIVLLFIFCLLSCSRKYYSIEKEYASNFSKVPCKDSNVFFTPFFEVFGFDFDEIDTVKIIGYKKNNKFDTRLDSSIIYLTVNDLLGPDAYHYYDPANSDTFLYQDYLLYWPTKRFVLNRDVLSGAKDYIVKFGSKYTYKIAAIEFREMYINRQKDTKICGLYSYLVNGKKVHYHNFIFVKDNKRQEQRNYFYINRRGVFKKKGFSDSLYYGL